MRSKKTFSVLGAAALALVAQTAVAAPTLRKQVDQRGDFKMIGNTLAHDCAAATPAPIVGTIGACGLEVDDNAPDVFWSSDTPGSGQAFADLTVLSGRSTAQLDLPVGATVTHAYLYWAAAVDTDRADSNAVLERPGVFDATVTAIASKRAAINNHRAYQSVADVTDLVKEHGPGAYRVSGVDTMALANLRNFTVFSGWWMAVFYELSSDPPRNIALFDGLDLVENGVAAQATLSGFKVPSGGAGFDGKLGVVAYDGDDVYTNDQLFFNNVALGDAVNGTTNFFNGSRSYLGSPVSVVGDLPQLTGGAGSMSGLDLDVVNITANLTSGQTSAPIRATAVAGGDDYLLGGFITSISTLSPDFSSSTKTVKDVNGGEVLPGDTLEYTINVRNTGNDSSTGTVLVDPLPKNVTFVPGSIEITSGANAGKKTDTVGDDQGEYITGSRTVRVRLGADANGTTGGKMAVGDASVVTFRVKIDAGAKGTIGNQAIITASGSAGGAETSTVTDGNGTGTGKPPTVIAIDGDCTTDADCGDLKSGRVCDDTAHKCVDGCRGKDGNGCPSGELCSSTTKEIGSCENPNGGGSSGPDEDEDTDGDGSGGSSGNSASPTDDVLAYGSGILCNARPGESGGASVALLTIGAMAVLGAARRRRRR